MLPRIQYAQASDRVSIAFWAIGDGVPLLLVYPPGFSNIQYEWEIPEASAVYEDVRQWATLIRFDHRNNGLSERGVANVSLEAHVADIEAVINRLDLRRVHLFATTDTGKAGIIYAAEHPEKVASLTLFRTNPGVGSSAAAPGWSNIRPLIERDWNLFTDVMVTALNGLEDGAQTSRLARFVRESVTPEEFVASITTLAEADVRGALANLQCPVLVLHRMDTPFFQIDRARQLVASVPDARLAVLAGKSPFAWDSSVVNAVKPFVLEVASAENRARFGLRSGTAFRTILFTDIEFHGELMRRHGDQAARQLLREHERITREALSQHGGSEIKSMGDGFLASFNSAQRALECAADLQRALAASNLGGDASGLSRGLRVRVGINAGEPIAEDDDLFGTAVIAAARIASMAAGGEVLVANVVRELVAGKGFLFHDRGEQPLRGLEDPVRLWQLLWDHQD
ncbi:MAG TPA: adenylate/guanylate cyclase domain-containing protein [Tepidiformaceae bacterium]|nr:adenylate/guanylate cyclase domain-containing protein [Tepidiformaceae bacterium]